MSQIIVPENTPQNVQTKLRKKSEKKVYLIFYSRSQHFCFQQDIPKTDDARGIIIMRNSTFQTPEMATAMIRGRKKPLVHTVRQPLTRQALTTALRFDHSRGHHLFGGVNF